MILKFTSTSVSYIFYDGFPIAMFYVFPSFVLIIPQSKFYLMLLIVLYVVLYGCETWSLTLREERRLRVFENRVLRKVFGPKREEVTG